MIDYYIHSSFDPMYSRYRYGSYAYEYSSSSSSTKNEIPPEITYKLNPGDVKLRYVALNIFTFGLWNYFQKKEFQATLLNNDISKASEIFSKCVIKDIGENFLRELINKPHTEALSYISNLDSTSKISHFIFDSLHSPKKMDDYLSHLSPFEATCLVKSSFAKKNAEQTTALFLKYGLSLSDVEQQVERRGYEIANATDDNLKLLKFYLDLGIKPNTGFLLNWIICRLPRSSDLTYNQNEKADNKKTFEIAKEMIQLLLEKGADPNKVDSTQYRSGQKLPLSAIIERCPKKNPMGLEIAKLLLDYNADPNKAYRKDGWTIFDDCLFNSDCAQLISMMYEKGGRTSTETLNRVFESVVHPNSGELERSIAIPEKLKLLKRYGGEISQSKCTKAFNLAIKAQDKELARFFKENGADTSQFDKFVEYIRS